MLDNKGALEHLYCGHISHYRQIQLHFSPQKLEGKSVLWCGYWPMSATTMCSSEASTAVKRTFAMDA